MESQVALTVTAMSSQLAVLELYPLISRTNLLCSIEVEIEALHFTRRDLKVPYLGLEIQDR